MKASKLIQKIQETIDFHGDGDVVIINETEESMYFIDDIYFDTVNQEPQIVIEVK